MPRKRNQFFSVGKRNKLIDWVFHPLAKEDPRFWWVDGIVHTLNEQDPISSVEKFVRYNVPKMVEQYLKKSGRKRYSR
ncbi:MAG: hypothetical protein ABSF00_09730 [Candidatus Bathyarchaeia archaeon]